MEAGGRSSLSANPMYCWTNAASSSEVPLRADEETNREIKKTMKMPVN